MALSAALQAELDKPQGGSFVTVVTLALPGGTRRYVLGAGEDALDGAGVMTEISSLSRSFDYRNHGLQDLEFNLLLADPEDEIAALVEGADSRGITGSVVTRMLGSLHVPSADWSPTFVGVIAGKPELEGPKSWRFRVRPDDRRLRGSFPRASIDFADWPHATEDALAQFGPLLYGKHDSAGNTEKGAVPLLCVDTAAFKYLLCWGRAKAVSRIYGDGTPIASGWSISYPILNSGRLATVVTFTSSQGSKAITADCEGYESVGDGTGALIDNGAHQIVHELSNWMLGDYRSGPWLGTSTLVDGALFDQVAEYLAIYGGGSSRRLFGDQRKGLDVLNEWAESHEVNLFWTAEGKIGASLVEPQTRDIYSDTAWLRYDDEKPSGRFGVKLRPDTENLIDRIDIQHLFGEAAGKYLRSLTVADPTLGLDASESLQLPWSAAYL